MLVVQLKNYLPIIMTVIFEILGKRENDISWWIYSDEDKRKIYIKNEDGSEKKSTFEQLNNFGNIWKMKGKRN